MPSRVNRQSLSLEIWPQYECGTHTSSFSHCPCGMPGCFEEFGSKQENSGSHNGGTTALPFHTSVFAGEWLPAFWFLPYGTIGPFSLLASSNQFLLAINYNYSFFLKGGEIKVTKGRGYIKGNCPTAKVWVISWGLGFGLTDFQFEFWFGVLLEHSAPTLIYLSSWDCDEVGDNGWVGSKPCDRDFQYDSATSLIAVLFL